MINKYLILYAIVLITFPIWKAYTTSLGWLTLFITGIMGTAALYYLSKTIKQKPSNPTTSKTFKTMRFFYFFLSIGVAVAMVYGSWWGMTNNFSQHQTNNQVFTGKLIHEDFQNHFYNANGVGIQFKPLKHKARANPNHPVGYLYVQDAWQNRRQFRCNIFEPNCLEIKSRLNVLSHADTEISISYKPINSFGRVQNMVYQITDQSGKLLFEHDYFQHKYSQQQKQLYVLCIWVVLFYLIAFPINFYLIKMQQ